MAVIRVPSFATPFSRSSQSSRTTGIVVLGDKVLEDLLGDVGLEDPHGSRVAVDGRGALTLVAVVLAVLPAPGVVVLVVLVDAMVELAGEAADGVLAAAVGPAEATAGEPAEVDVGGDDHDRFAHPLRLHRGADAGRGAAIDDHVINLLLGRIGRCRPDQQGHQQNVHRDSLSPRQIQGSFRSHIPRRHGHQFLDLGTSGGARLAPSRLAATPGGDNHRPTVARGRKGLGRWGRPLPSPRWCRYVARTSLDGPGQSNL